MQLEAIFALSKWPPTMANTNPPRWLVVRAPEAKQRLAPHMSEGNRAKTLAAPANVVLCADVDFHDTIPTLLPHKPELRERYAGDASKREEAARKNSRQRGQRTPRGGDRRPASGVRRLSTSHRCGQPATTGSATSSPSGRRRTIGSPSSGRRRRKAIVPIAVGIHSTSAW